MPNCRSLGKRAGFTGDGLTLPSDEVIMMRFVLARKGLREKDSLLLRFFEGGG